LTPPANTPVLWSTASFGDSVDTSPMELEQLGAHLDRCHVSKGRWFTLRCLAESMNGFVAPRFVTTLVLAALAIGLASLAF
jgi:hypothetical protein